MLFSLTSVSLYLQKLGVRHNAVLPNPCLFTQNECETQRCFPYFVSVCLVYQTECEAHRAVLPSLCLFSLHKLSAMPTLLPNSGGCKHQTPKRLAHMPRTHQQSIVIPDEDADNAQQTQDNGEERPLNGCGWGRGRQSLAVLEAGREELDDQRTDLLLQHEAELRMLHTHTHTHTHIHTTLSANSQLAVEVVKSIVKNNQKTLFFHRNILASTTMKRTTNGGEDGRVGGEDRHMKTKSTNGKDFRVGEDRHMKTKSTIKRRWQSRR